MTGRQRSFEKDAMLRTIMCVFWRNGYAGTSMANLTNATGLTKPSLYLAYGNKEQIFKASLGHYLEMQSETIGGTLHMTNGTVADRIADFLKASARSATQTDRPSGCFILAASSEAHSSTMPTGIRALIDNINNMALNMLIDFFKKSVGVSAERSRLHAEYVLVLQSGVMQMALRGLDYAALENVIELSLERAVFD